MFLQYTLMIVFVKWNHLVLAAILAFFSIILYADDIWLLAPSISSLQTLLSICEYELRLLDLAININKSVCTRIGPKFADECSGI